MTIKEEFPQYIKEATSKLPFIAKHVDRPGLVDGKVDSIVGMERMKTGVCNNGTITIHERIVPGETGEYRALSIVQDLTVGYPPVRSALIVNGELVKLVGCDDMTTEVGKISAVVALIIGFLECTEFMTVEEGMSNPFVML